MSEIAKEIKRLQAKRTMSPQKYGKQLAKNKELLKSINSEYDKLRNSLDSYLSDSMEKEWQFANFKNDELVENYIKGNISASYMNHNSKALKSFLKSRPFRSKIWELTADSKQLVTDYIATGITQGRSSVSIARDLNRINSNPYNVTVFDADGNPTKLSKVSPFIRDYKAQKGQYKKPLSNLKRLVRTETNKAYRTSDNERMQQLDFIVGYEVHLSDSHPKYDICDEMKGKYPKSFSFTGWHPHCYKDDVQVMTNNGWKFFYDVDKSDLIFSLNPKTKIPEYVGTVASFKRLYKGELIHFNNKFLSIPVTPDHDMVYQNKNDGRFSKKKAIDYNKNNGGIYRSSEYIGNHIESIQIGIHDIDFNVFCEFMGYYLSDGSIVQKRPYRCTISQIKEKSFDNYCNIEKLVDKLPLNVSKKDDGFHFHDESFYNYLKQFGKAPDKYIPSEILNSSKAQIQIFLNAYISCDGSIIKPKNFIGNRGNEFKGKTSSRYYFTTSDQMASDIGECIVKINKRPSFKLRKEKGKSVVFKNGEYKTNNDLWVISECVSKSSTAFDKSLIDYNGFVYDLELSRNHIMYLRHNGKPFWGHNCLCYTTTILKTKEEFRNDVEKSKNEVTEIPKSAQTYVKTMKPYWKDSDWYKDNYKE